MKMERCKTCKHWEKLESDCGEVPGTGKCKAVVPFWNATKWAANGYERTIKTEYGG